MTHNQKLVEYEKNMPKNLKTEHYLHNTMPKHCFADVSKHHWLTSANKKELYY